MPYTFRHRGHFTDRLKPTGYLGVSYCRTGAGNWRCYNRDPGEWVGPLHRSEPALLADMDRLASEHGWMIAVHPCRPAPSRHDQAAPASGLAPTGHPCG